MRRYLYMLICLVVSASCSDFVHETDEYRNIQFRASVSEPMIVSKADPLVEAVPWRGTTPSDENRLKVKLMLSMESGVYKSVPASANFLPCHTWIEYTDNQFHDPAPVTYTPAGGSPMTGQPKYPTSRDSNDVIDKVYCTGLYPEEGWTVPESGTSASHAIDGVQDLMYAPQIEGSLEALFGPQTYGHLLTWIKVCVCATSQDALNVWGNIEKVYVTGKSEISLNLADGSCSFSSEKDFLVHDTSIPLATTIASVGSLFCAPQSSFVVKVKSSNFDEIKVVTIKRDPENDEAKFEPGKLYVLEIYFGTSTAEGICRLVPWDYQDESLNLS